MIDFAADLAAISADVLGGDAIYTPAGGAPTAIRIIPRSGDARAAVGDITMIIGQIGVLIPQSAVADPRAGDHFTWRGKTWTVAADPVADARGLVWMVEARE